MDSQPARGSGPRTGVLLAGVLLLAILAAVGVKLASRPEPAKPAPQASEPAPATNVAAAALPPPGTLITAEEVLDKLDQWNLAHPNSRSVYTTAFPNGTVISKMEYFAYTNGTNSATVKVNAQIYHPELEFTGYRENGKMWFYFPRDKQLIQTDMKREMFFMPTAPPSLTRSRDLLKQAHSSFAEASEDLEVVTLAIDGAAMNFTNQLYLSLRVNHDGQPLGIGVAVQDQNVMTTIKYLSFDRDAIMRDAPVFPAGIAAVTNSTLVQAVLQEINTSTPTPLRPRTI